MNDRDQIRHGIMAGSIVDEQLDLELQSVEEGIQNYWKLANEAIRRGDGAALKPSERLLVWWMPMIRSRIMAEQEAIRQGKPDIGRQIYGPAMLLLDAERIGLLALHEAVGRCLQADGVTTAELAYAIGAAVLGEASLDLLKAEKPDAYAELTRICKTGVTPRHGATWAKRHLQDPVWNRKVAMHLGAKLIELLLTLPAPCKKDEKPKHAFAHKIQRDRGKDVGMVRLSKDIVAQLATDHSVRAKMRPSYQPMLIQPLAWTPNQQGGYCKIRVPLVSKTTADQREALKHADLRWTFAGLNAVASSCWRINKPVLQVLLQIQAGGGSLAGVPRQFENPMPRKPEDIDTNKAAKAEWKKEAKKVHRANRVLAGECRVFSNTMDCAKLFANKDRSFYFPNWLDFRGRAYPIPASLNHYGPDISRGLLMASDPAPLGDRGVYWLHVHAANSAGQDKMEFADRAAWTKKWIADNRVHEWIGSDDGIINAAADTWASTHPERKIKRPVQFLSALIGLFYPDYGRRVPIHRDGTANGLQHYAAIGRDREGAEAVSLCGPFRPGGVYSQVSDIVRSSVAKDVNATKVLAVTVRGKTYSFETGPIARAMLPLVCRDMAKPIVMRKVYGVTEYGAKKAIRDFILEAGVKMDPPERYCATKYIVGKMMEAIGQVCSAAREIMDHLAETARACVADGQPMQHTTPLGFPVVQPYRRWEVVQIRTSLQWLDVLVETDKAPIAKRKHVTSFAPNFIHSIDAAHMMMTANECVSRNIWFAAVHDSFWCRAGEVDQMDRIIREQFVRLHEIDILGNLHDELRQRFPKAKLPPIPPKGTFDITEVLRAPYAFQ